MKKLLFGFLGVSAGVALATTEVTVATVDVIAIDSGMKNTVVAIPGLDLSDGGNLAVSNLVKTTNLTAGDKLYAFSNGEYETWVLNNSLHWEQAAQRYTIKSTGAEESTATPASIMWMDVGSGIWLSRQTYASGNSFYVYGAHADGVTNVVAASATVLLGNPVPTYEGIVPTVIGAQNGDQVIVPTAMFPKYYKFDGSVWKSTSGSTGLPQIMRGTGFWYKASASGSDRKVSWL